MKRIFTQQQVAVYIALLCSLGVQLYPSNVRSNNVRSNVVHQSHEKIIEAATNFALQAHAQAEKVEISIPPLDQRLLLPACTLPLEVFQPRGSALQGLTTIGIQCTDVKPWKIRVRADIKVYDFIAVLSRSVRRGEEITEDNIHLELTDLSTLRRDSLTEIASLIGYRFKRRYSASRPLDHSMLDEPRLIEKGQNVLIVTENTNIKVRMKGVALADGEKGGLIRVRNLSSGRIVQGYVAESGIVNVRM